MGNSGCREVTNKPEDEKSVEGQYLENLANKEVADTAEGPVIGGGVKVGGLANLEDYGNSLFSKPRKI